MMAQLLNRLTAAEVRQATAGDMLPDGGGLFFSATGPGAGSWEWRYYRFNIQHWMGLGSFQDVSLAQAREDRLKWRQVLRSGKDPIQERRDQRLAMRKQEQLRKPFREVFEEWLTTRISAGAWKNKLTPKNKRNRVALHAYPIIGSVFADQIDTPMVLQVLQPMWDAKKIRTARDVCGDLEAALDYAKFKEYRRGDNPAAWESHIASVAHKMPDPKHFASVNYRELPAFWAELRSQKGRGIAVEALKFLILTANRPNEVAGAPWAEFAGYKNTKIWRIPKERMKAERDHYIPLSNAAIAILEKMERLRESDFVFPGRDEVGRHMTEAALNRLLYRRGLGGLATPHGFRATFRSWGSAQWEKLSEAQQEYRMYLLELCLAHKIAAAETIGAKADLLAAYDRDELVEQRRPIMDAWGKFVTNPPTMTEQVGEDKLAEAAD